MAKVFRFWDVDQGWLLPPSLHEFVPPGHMAHFVRDTVREALDLSAILDTEPPRVYRRPFGLGQAAKACTSAWA